MMGRMNAEQRIAEIEWLERIFAVPDPRRSANDAALVLIEHQSGIMQLVHDYSAAELRNNVIGLAKLGKV
jgi:hypothetical protein